MKGQDKRRDTVETRHHGPSSIKERPDLFLSRLSDAVMGYTAVPNHSRGLALSGLLV